MAEIQQFLRVVSSEQDLLRLAVCKLIPAKRGHCKEVLVANLASSSQQTLALDIAELDTKLVTAVGGNPLHGLAHKNTSGMG